MFNFPNVPAATVGWEIDQFIGELKADGFDFTEMQHDGGEGSRSGGMPYFREAEESPDSRI
ncbi:MAG: hypothetical protein NTW63_02660, partial [Caldiserica bacterium]|nr:hypothetical protein [Caldisericota bacterium]